MFASEIDLPERPRIGRHTCRSCDATPSGCAGLQWLRGRGCCPDCDHGPVEEES